MLSDASKCHSVLNATEDLTLQQRVGDRVYVTGDFVIPVGEHFDVD